jgi:FK506-binding protein 1
MLLLFLVVLCLLGPASGLRASSRSIRIRSSALRATVKLAEGVSKEVVSRGAGRGVEAGDILAIDYSASTQGKVFAKSTKEQFIVKDGSLIKGWDVAVGSMIVGERAKFVCAPQYAYGATGVLPVIPPNADIELDIKILAWLGNQLRPETIFSKDLDVDPFIASTPETIQADYDEMEARKEDKYQGNIFQIYLRRLKNISFGFGGVGFFTSQSGEKAPWYLNPNITFPFMITIVVAAFFTVLTTGSVKEKGAASIDPDLASVHMVDSNNLFS